VDEKWFGLLDSYCREHGLYLLYWRHMDGLPMYCANAYLILILELEGEDTYHAVVVRTVPDENPQATDAAVEKCFALSELAGNTQAQTFAWKSELMHDPNERGYPPVKGPVGYIMIGST
jgi:hypothetical protein